MKITIGEIRRIVQRHIMEYADHEVGTGAYADFDNDSGGKFWGNLGAGVLPYCPKTGRFLLGLRSPYVNEPNTWNLWGGKVEEHEGDNMQLAAEREFREETEYNDAVELSLLYVFESNGGDFKYYNYLGTVEDEFYAGLNHETSKARWLRYDELIKLPNLHFGMRELLQNVNLKQKSINRNYKKIYNNVKFK